MNIFIQRSRVRGRLFHFIFTLEEINLPCPVTLRTNDCFNFELLFRAVFSTIYFYLFSNSPQHILTSVWYDYLIPFCSVMLIDSVYVPAQGTFIFFVMSMSFTNL